MNGGRTANDVCPRDISDNHSSRQPANACQPSLTLPLVCLKPSSSALKLPKGTPALVAEKPRVVLRCRLAAAVLCRIAEEIDAVVSFDGWQYTAARRRRNTTSLPPRRPSKFKFYADQDLFERICRYVQRSS